MKKVIGVMPLWDEEKQSLWMLPGYLGGIAEAGGLPLLFPLKIEADALEQLCGMCDGFLLTGGQDVNPALYGEEPLVGLVEPCSMRDNLEQQVLEYALSRNKAVLGICRGIQFINVALGGTLYQDLPMQHPSNIEHRMSPPYDRVCHEVHIAKDTELYQLLQMETLGVNSYHHQAVRALAPGLRVMARARDGLVEAVCMETQKFLWALQWHPELSYKTDEHSKKVFAAFVGHC